MKKELKVKKMKRKIFSLKSFLFAGVIMLVTMISCQDKDTTAPKAKLDGPNPYHITLNDRYVEYGFEYIYDNRDDTAEMDIKIEHEIDTLEGDILNVDGHNIFLGEGATIQTGNFEVTYTITDKAGNQTILIRDVVITNSLDKFSREYTVEKENLSDPTDTYEDYTTELEAYEDLNNRILFPGFSDFDDANISVYADVKGDSIFIALQNFFTSNGYIIDGIESENDGYAGIVNHTNYKITIRFTAANNTQGAQEFEQTYTKL